jgi:hypothetical protein
MVETTYTLTDEQRTFWEEVGMAFIWSPVYRMLSWETRQQFIFWPRLKYHVGLQVEDQADHGSIFPVLT